MSDATSGPRFERRHMEGMSMGMGMGMGKISLLWPPQVYWIVIGSVIAAFTLVNLANQLLFRQRLRLAARNQTSPAKPNSFLSRVYATLTAVLRELSNCSLPSFQLRGLRFKQPTLGRTALVLVNVAVAVTLCLYQYDATHWSSFQNIAYECGFISLAQIPLIFLLAGKNNIVGFLTGSSYERLNWLHRWAARTLLMTTTIHMGYWFAQWAPYNFIGYEIKNDTVTQRGLASWCILVWIVFSSFAPIRGWSYEIFVLQHTISYIGLVAMLFLHTPTHVHGWLWAPVAIYLFDRLTRALYTVYINLSIFQPKGNRQGVSTGFWSCRAELTPISRHGTRVTIHNPPISWKPGQHAFFSCHSIAPLQSHPFTIASLPEDGKLEFYIEARSGSTRRFLDFAKNRRGLPLNNDGTTSTVPVIVDGPYGRMRPPRQFDSVTFFAGSTGATFTVPHLRDIVRRWKITASEQQPSSPSSRNLLASLTKEPETAVTRRIHFVWAVKSRQQIEWFQNDLNQVAEDLQELSKQGQDVRVGLSIYITCDDSLTADWSNSIKRHTPFHDPADPLDTSDSSSTSSAENDKLATPCTVARRVYTAKSDPHVKLDATSCECKASVSSSTDAPNLSRNITCDCHGSDVKAGELAGLHPNIVVQTGRPKLRNIMQDMLEAAHGESAVVSCGPQSMNEECRRAAVSLSDERAVHKGTGALGIWYWGEGYGYA